ncbi:stage III sporulation protein AA [Melghirimyces thermohalophilus]|uniref:Stage III sporulation protein AA n=1 Tax=Melghirimyces thermohalophilus TaxID=1236220 RepID=A0A1G6Q8S5_9BACL|nr:stage III sporulation protein AA [Melghirimyces thermohalophilus]SDC88631.1 stage III sporulation protein AA [Melghirimyces thermohalophilus]
MLSPILEVLPLSIRGMVESLPGKKKEHLEEIRVRQGRPLEVVSPWQYGFVSDRGRLVNREEEAYRPGREDCEKMLNLISNHSLYALEEELRRGYVTIKGGHRIGLAGRVVVEGGQVKHIREVAGFNVRIARQVKGSARSLLPRILRGSRLENLMIVSPPQCGKTTLLRDLVRIVSQGEGIASRKVGVVDERSEIAGCIDGVPQHEIGPRTDVLDGCPKAEGMMMMIRSMSPELLVVDEIGRREDSEAVFEAIHAGVQLFTTAHAKSMEELCRRPGISELVREGVFSRYVLLSRRKGPGTVEGIYDRNLCRITGREATVTG